MDLSTSMSSDKYKFRYELIVWVIFAIAWFSILGTRALFHTDEGRYATISLNMLLSNDWITPRLNGILYFEKPILQYWGGAIIFWLFGVSDFTARLYPAITSFLTIIMVSYTARRIWDVRSGQFAALFCAGFVWMGANGHVLTLDMGTTFFLNCALCALILTFHEKATLFEQKNWILVAWAAMAFATLSKGLIGFVIPGAVFFFYTLFNNQWRLWLKMRWIVGLIVFFAICAPWFTLVIQKNPSFYNFFFIHEHIERFLTTEHHREGPIYYFVPLLIVGALPWTSWLPRIFMNGVKNKEPGFRAQRLLMIWCVFIFLFFSKSGSKLPSYILPMFPAIALMLAWQFNRIKAETVTKHLWVPLIFGIFMLLAYPITLIFADKIKHYQYMIPLFKSLILSGILFLIATYLAYKFIKKEKVMLSTLCLSLGMYLALIIGAQGYDMGFGSRFKSSRDIVPIIAKYANENTQYFSVDTYDQTLPFYLRKNIKLVKYVGEFEFGETQEPSVWIPTYAEFTLKWNSAPSAVAMISPGAYKRLKAENLPMKIIYEDERRKVVVKP